ncbi:MAG: protein CapI, partial [Sphingomonas sp.]
IDDIIAGVIACLDTPPADDGSIKAGGGRAPHALYNIGNHRSEQLGHMIDLIEAACGKTAIRDLQPIQPGDVPATYADIDAIQQVLGFQPRTSIDVGVPAFVEWYRAYHGS